MSRSLLSSIGLATLFAICAAQAVAQAAPDLMFERRLNLGGGFGSPVVVDGPWDSTWEDTLPPVTWWKYATGTPSANGITVRSRSLQDHPEAAGSSGQTDVQVNQRITILSRYKGSHRIDATTSASVAINTYGRSRKTSYFGIPLADSISVEKVYSYSPETVALDDSYEQTNSLTVNLGCSPTGITYAQYPGVTYYAISTGDFDITAIAQADVSSGDTWYINSEGTTAFTVTRGGSNPLAGFNGPTVEGSSGSPYPLGATASFTNTSYDEDNGQGSAPMTGLCSKTWTVTWPDGHVTNDTTSVDYSMILSQNGQYKVKLTVVDDEGVTAEHEVTFTVGEFPEPCPGEGLCNPNSDGGYDAQGRSGSAGGGAGQTNPAGGMSANSAPTTSVGGGDSWGNCGVSLRSGNAQCGFSTGAVSTASFGLNNDIFLNTQSWTTRTTPMGNAQFTYGMRVGAHYVGLNNINSNRILFIDGNGAEWDFGTLGQPLTRPAGFFAVLTDNQDGTYTLSEAGPPGAAHLAGNFTYEFNGIAQLTSITDPQGNVQELRYNSNFDLYEVEDVSTGRKILFEYDTPNRIARVVQNGPAAVTHLGYTDDKLSSIELKDGNGVTSRSASISYNADDLPYQITKDGNSSTTMTFTYEPSGWGTYFANMSTSAGATNYDYFVAPSTGYWFRHTETTAQGGVIAHDLNSRMRVGKTTYPILNGATAATVISYVLNTDFQVLETSNGINTFSYTYNTKGKLLTVNNNAGGLWTYNYAANGIDLESITDSVGTVLELDYDDVNQPHIPTGFTDGANNTWTQTLNTFGQVTQVTPPTGSPTGSTTFTYESDSQSPNYGWLTSVTNGEGESATFDSYSLLGDVTSISTSPSLGITNSTQFAYDTAQRLTLLTNDDATTVQYEYDGKDLATVTDEALTDVDYSWCPGCGRLTGETLPLNKSLSWSLNIDYALTGFTDARQNTTQYQYGLAGELKKVTTPDGIYTAYLYDNYGRLKEIDFNSTLTDTVYTYDTAGRISSRERPLSSQTDTYTYYADGSLNTATTATAGTISYTYTADRRIDTETYDFSVRGLTALQVVDYDYNPDGTISALTWRSGTTTVASWSYSYDLAGRVTSITNSFGETTGFTYDDEGKLLTQTNANNTSLGYGYYEPRGWANSITHRAGGTPFASYALTYDQGANTVGNLTGVTELDGSTVSYGYDGLYRLTSETRTGTGPYTRTLGYDLAGNVTSKDGTSFATYDSANKITPTSGTLTHNFSGSIYTMTITGVPGGRYDWDGDGHLTYHDLSRYYYFTDGVGRRFAKSYRGYATQTTYYIFAGDVLIGEVYYNAPTRAYTWGPNGLISQRVLGTGAHSGWYHYGPQAETRYLTNSSGAILNTYNYNAYGETLASTGTEPNSFRYGGQYGYYFDTNVNFYLAGARWYHPYLMRWMTRDPISYDGGENLYAYVKGNPIKYVDPDGLENRWYAPGSVRNSYHKPITVVDVDNKRMEVVRPYGSSSGVITDWDFFMGPDGKWYKIGAGPAVVWPWGTCTTGLTGRPATEEEIKKEVGPIVDQHNNG